MEGSRCLLFHGKQPNLTNFLFRRFNNPIVIDCLTFPFSSGTSSLWTATAAGFFRCMFIYLLIMFAGISLYFFRNCVFLQKVNVWLDFAANLESCKKPSQANSFKRICTCTGQSLITALLLSLW